MDSLTAYTVFNGGWLIVVHFYYIYDIVYTFLADNFYRASVKGVRLCTACCDSLNFFTQNFKISSFLSKHTVIRPNDVCITCTTFIHHTKQSVSLLDVIMCYTSTVWSVLVLWLIWHRHISNRSFMICMSFIHSYIPYRKQQQSTQHD